MDANNLIVYLPFDTSTTLDLCGNSWTAYGSPTLENGALKLDGSSSYLAMDGGITLGGQDFTIAAKINLSSAAGSWIHIFNLWTSNSSDANKIALQRNYSNAQCRGLFFGSVTDTFNFALDTVHHFEFDYVHAVGRIYVFVDGALMTTFNKSIPQTIFPNVHIGRSNYSNPYFVGTIDEFMIFVGVALHTEDFTPPTAEDYADLKFALGATTVPLTLNFDTERRISNRVEVIADVERRLKWRYVNYGTADTLTVAGTTLTNLPESKSRTGSAFYQTTRAKCFDLPATSEVWIKFDVYFDGTNRWRAYNGGANDITGITAQQTDSNKIISVFSNGTNVQQTYGFSIPNQLQTVLLHMVSGTSDGVVEAWVDGTLIYSYSGDVNHGSDFADIYLQSDGAGTFFSNVIISNARLTFGDGYQKFSADTERRVKNIAEFLADVSRRVKNVTNVEFAADVRRNVTRSNFFAADVVRNVTRSLELTADVEVLDVIPVEFIADISRAIITNINLYSTDTSDYFSGGTSTPIVIPSQDVVPPVDGDAHLQSIEISIAEQQLTDQVKVVGITPLDILFPVQGQYLDYVCDMRVEKVQRQGILYTADCCSDIDEILYTQFNYKLDSGFTYFAPDYDSMTLAKIISDIDDNEPPPNLIRKGRATAHLQKIANLLGKNCVCQFDDFTSNMNEKQSDVTFGDLISQLFGWTSRLPQRLINCYLRDDTLFAIQRGHESNVIDISHADITLPTYEWKLIRTLWGSGKLGIEPTTESEHVNNKHMVGGAKVFPMPPTTSPDGKTTYNYHNVSGYGGIDHGYALTSTTTTNDDGSRHEVRYNYGFEQGVYVCTSEESKDYDADGNLVNENKIIHHNLTPSQQFSRIEDEDGITTASNVGSNLPGFYNESYWLSLPHEVGYERDINKITGYNPLIDTDFPVLDSDIYAALIDAYAWLNRRTQETVTLSIYNCPHLFDFNDRILFDGNEYFLVGNTARTTPRIFNEQTLTLRRWF